VDPIERALKVWAEADGMIDTLVEAGEDIDDALQIDYRDDAFVNQQLLQLDALNDKLTDVENKFSEILGAGSRWLENLLMIVLVLAVLTVESTGVLLTITFARNLNRSLKELTSTAAEVGRGNFEISVPVRSRDELGQLADSINKMAVDLKNSLFRRDRAESASQVKSQFLANMSHEIRTPLGLMLGLTEILKDPKLTWQEQMNYVETIERTGKNLTRIINDILDLSKVEAGHLEIEKTQFSLAEFMQDLSVMLQVQAEKTGNRLNFTAKGELPAEISTDRTRLRQILVNLVNNALKYTAGGDVELSYWREGEQMIFEVRDNGRGIRDSEREKLFEAFVRTEDPERDKPEGTGLGLMLSKRLARALGGDVSLVRSEPGVGSVFRATIAAAPNLGTVPAAAKPKTKARGGPSGELGGRKILVVEDSEDNQLLVKLFLSRAGMSVDFANNGQEGVEQALNHDDYDAILMDMQMPVKDGYRATKELREHGFNKPIIALTAHAMKDDRERCLKAGCSDYLTKPVDSKALADTILRHIAAGEADA
jgi:signal transduction histidine kinase/CheY-like chemotaxis protein